MNFKSKPAKTITALGSAVLAMSLLAACGSTASEAPASSSAAAESAAQTPSQVLSSTAWETTGAVDQDGNKVELTDDAAKNYVGFAYFNDGGDFQMYTLDDAPKMQGDWTVSEDGKTRHIVAKDGSGKTLFERDSEITELTGDEFTYRTYPEEGNKEVYVDIIHTPTDHAEPAALTPSQVLSSTAWETTGAVDQDGEKVELTDDAAKNYVGYAYFNEGGDFTMYTLEDAPKMQGDWTVSEDGKTRHIVAKDESGKTLFERDSEITELTKDEFTYRVPSEEAKGEYVDIIHTPTDHAEPAGK
ncbi:DUF4822 domain-containing protein [Glutamicibacter sp.]|uniref:DUF4822 domain-containing protein n=1 Tax=Glutamicibacter sp. TaxID=1931995 RepID=UPI0028BEDA6B|nr:DUF4822 domain-containing protein [Glutamicibacter sp.]